MTRWGWTLAAAAVVSLGAGCTDKADLETRHRGPTDAGVVDTTPPTSPSGTPDAGPPDAGPPDAGPPDAGPPPLTVVPYPLPTAPGWTFYGVEQGGPTFVYGVSADEGGNIWVAGGEDGLFLLEPGATRLRRFTAADGLTPYVDASGARTQPVISVAGGRAGTVIVGYRGVGNSDYDPPTMLKSGDADRVTLTPSGTLEVAHYDISSRPGQYSEYPNGREKIRTVHRIAYDRASGSVWFGGDHGVALRTAGGTMWEHQHAAINGYTKSGEYTLLSGDWFGLSLTPEGDAWMGGNHRITRLPYATSGGDFWSDFQPVDVWPDAVAQDARPEQRTDDDVQDLAAESADSVWVGSISNGLAHVGPGGVSYFDRTRLVDPKVTALERDPANGSLWVGHLYGGLSRLQDGSVQRFDYRTFGGTLIQTQVPDVQSATLEGRRRILVAFQGHLRQDGTAMPGAVGIYSGD